MTLHFHRQFTKQLKKLTEKERALVKERLELFLLDPYHPRLRNHSLRGKYLGYRSIDIRPDIRAIFKHHGDDAIFVQLGSHNKLFS